MHYNYEAIGKRIQEERKKAKIKTQSALAEKLDYSPDSRQLIISWEKGTAIPTMDNALKLCELFNCELGYLLCEPNYTLPTGRDTDIHAETGLSEKAISVISDLKATVRSKHSREEETGNLSKIELLNRIIEDPRFRKLLMSLQAAKSIEYNEDSEITGDLTAAEFAKSMGDIQNMGMVPLRGEDAATYYLQNAVKLFTDIIYSIPTDFSGGEVYSTVVIDLDKTGSAEEKAKAKP